MSGFNEREKDFENKYAYEEKMGFKIEARAAKLFGLWAAEKMGLAGAAAQTYAMDMVSAKLESAGFEAIQKKADDDFTASGVDITDHVIRAHFDKAYEEARHQIMNEGQ